MFIENIDPSVKQIRFDLDGSEAKLVEVVPCTVLKTNVTVESEIAETEESLLFEVGQPVVGKLARKVREEIEYQWRHTNFGRKADNLDPLAQRLRTYVPVLPV